MLAQASSGRRAKDTEASLVRAPFIPDLPAKFSLKAPRGLDIPKTIRKKLWSLLAERDKVISRWGGKPDRKVDLL